MAEVFLGHAEGPAGFSKLVAIKRIHPHLAASGPEFVDMFLDEARLASRLDHPNIVQIIDLGRVDDHYFIAMEYIHGKTLRDLVRRATEYGQVLPLEAVLTVSLGVLSGLSFAHSRRGVDGRPAPVIHRDVSPQNILLSYSGNVKLADFGIAKAQDRISVTQDGVVKGKAYYMAPEQMYEGRVDQRVDIYAFGVVLHELLTGRRLFGKYTQSQLFNPQFRKQAPRPTDLVPGRPKQLDTVVLRMLAADPRRRYQSCGDVIAALEEVMLATRQMTSTERLGATMRLMFAVEREEEEQTVARATTPRPAGTPPALPSVTVTAPTALQDFPTLIKGSEAAGPIKPVGSLAETGLMQTAVAGLDEAATTVSTPPSGSLVQPVALTAGQARRRTPWAAIAIGGGLAALAASIGLHAVLTRSKHGSPRRTVLSAWTPDAALAADLRQAARSVTRDASSVAAAAPTDMHGTRRVRLRTRADRPAGRDPRPPPARLGTLDLSSQPPGKVYLGRRCLGPTPLQGARLPAGTHTLQLRNPALHLSHAFQVAIVAGQSTARRIQLSTGTLLVNAIPWARVYLDGRMLDVTPLKPLKLYPGPHVVELVYPGPSGEMRHREQVNIRSGTTYKVIHSFLRGAP